MGPVLKGRGAMERHLERNIKEVIAEFPAVEAILSEYDIGCAACAVGTCLLRDIIEVHGLSEDQERAVMERIAKAIFPGREVSIPLLARKSPAPRAKSAGFSPPVKALVDEHVVIKRLLALVPWIRDRLTDHADEGIEAARTAVEFIRTYADRFHHAKEEDILFGYFDSGMEILASMRREHDTARGLPGPPGGTHPQGGRGAVPVSRLAAGNDPGGGDVLEIRGGRAGVREYAAGAGSKNRGIGEEGRPAAGLVTRKLTGA